MIDLLKKLFTALSLTEDKEMTLNNGIKLKIGGENTSQFVIKNEVPMMERGSIFNKISYELMLTKLSPVIKIPFESFSKLNDLQK